MLISFAKYEEGFAAAAPKEEAANREDKNALKLRQKAPQTDPVQVMSETLTQYKKLNILSSDYLPLALSADVEKGEIARIFLTKLDRPVAILLVGENIPRTYHMESWMLLLKKFSEMAPEEKTHAFNILNVQDSMKKLISLSENTIQSDDERQIILILQFETMTEKMAKIINSSPVTKFITAKAKATKNNSFNSMFLDGTNKIDISWPQILMTVKPNEALPAKDKKIPSESASTNASKNKTNDNKGVSLKKERKSGKAKATSSKKTEVAVKKKQKHSAKKVKPSAAKKTKVKVANKVKKAGPKKKKRK